MDSLANASLSSHDDSAQVARQAALDAANRSRAQYDSSIGRGVSADPDRSGSSPPPSGMTRLQAANDARNLEDIREYTTPEMFAEIKMNWMDDTSAGQKTDVVSLNAEVIDVSEEAERYIVSVRFTGLLREETNAAPEGIDEIWHLTKPRSGNSGWLVAGVQQNG